MSNFSVSFRDAGPAHVLTLKGELDAHTASEFEAAIQDCLDSGTTRLVIDGAGLDYVSSAGLGVFMAYVEPIRKQDGDIKIAALQDSVFEIFDLLGFPILFKFFGSVEEGVSSYDHA